MVEQILEKYKQVNLYNLPEKRKLRPRYNQLVAVMLFNLSGNFFNNFFESFACSEKVIGRQENFYEMRYLHQRHETLMLISQLTSHSLLVT